MQASPPGTTPPVLPPPRPSGVGRLDRPRRSPMRLAGILLACSTPITGFLTYAVVAIVFGESRLEGEGGLTVAGLLVLVAPAIFGLALIAASYLTTREPTRRSVAVTLGALSAVFLGLGLWGSTTADDASIGGGLLVVASVPLGVLALALFGFRKRGASSQSE